jgi:hypothetical protein
MLLGGGRGRTRIGAVVALAAVLAMVLTSPAGAAGWGEERDWAGAVSQRVLAWLGLAPSPTPDPSPGVVMKCDAGPQVDPNGNCVVKAGRKQGPPMGPNGHS